MSREYLIGYLQTHFSANYAQIVEKLDQYASLLEAHNKLYNLTAIDPLDYYEKHFLDCLLVSESYAFTNQKIIDIGSGAGFPGLVLAIAFNDLHMTLLEPTTKRCEFLSLIVKTLSLTNVTVVNARAEDYIKEVRETFDIAISRAVAHLSIILELSVPFVKVGGKILLMKGKNYEAELKEDFRSLTTLNIEELQRQMVNMPSDQALHVNVLFQKKDKTPTIYPRSYGAIKKKPL